MPVCSPRHLVVSLRNHVRVEGVCSSATDRGAATCLSPRFGWHDASHTAPYRASGMIGSSSGRKKAERRQMGHVLGTIFSALCCRWQSWTALKTTGTSHLALPSPGVLLDSSAEQAMLTRGRQGRSDGRLVDLLTPCQNSGPLSCHSVLAS